LSRRCVVSDVPSVAVFFDLSVVALIAVITGAVVFWIYRDASARQMESPAVWALAVGTLFLFGLGIGGVFGVAAYLTLRGDLPDDDSDADTDSDDHESGDDDDDDADAPDRDDSDSDDDPDGDEDDQDEDTDT
jgi:hypothetical protein